MKKDRKTLYLTIAMTGLLLFAYALFFPPYADALVGDDYIQFDYVKDFVAEPALIWQVFNPYQLPWYYRPLQNVWWWGNQLILGTTPFGFYALQLSLHSLAVALLFRVARQLGMRRLPAFATVTLFAVHSHYVDVVGWISVIAIIQAAIFALIAVWCWLRYLARPSANLLLLTFAATLLTLLAHEEWILLPPILLLILLSRRQWRPGRHETGRRPPLNGREWALFCGFAILGLLYLYLQFTRPNITLDLSQTSTIHWLRLFTWPSFSDFIQTTAYHYTFFINLLSLSAVNGAFFVVFLLGLFLLWFWQGNKIVRLGLLWLALHLAFIYAALWNQLPELYAGRHIYQAGIGLALALGGTVEQLLPHTQTPKKRRKRSRAAASPRLFEPVMVILLLLASLLYHSGKVRTGQRLWVMDTREEKAAEQQLKALIPTLSPENHLFAYRFPIAPQFMRPVAQIWYDLPLSRPGGSIDHLRAHGEATDQFYLLDYEDGEVHILMPELQGAEQTIFIWAQPSRQEKITENGRVLAKISLNAISELIVVAANENRRLAIPADLTLADGEWLRQVFLLDVPAGSTLKTAVLLHSDLQYRLQLVDIKGQGDIVYQSPAMPAGSQPRWDEIAFPLDQYAGEALIMRLETKSIGERKTGYWANPRFEVGERE